MTENPNTPSDEIVLEARGITKQFPGVLANDNINFDLRKGEIHALLGENGAGKSTLMNLIYGLHNPDKGEIFVNGKPAAINSPNDSIKLGIGMVHQHFMLIPVFTVAENIMLGDETVKNGMLDQKTVAAKITQLSSQYGLEVNPLSLVGQLPVGTQQRVEIVKTLYRDAKIVILDEPTAVLTPQEADDLFRIMRDLTARGVSIIFITHKLKEVLAIADRITVMRAGRTIGTVLPKNTTSEKLATMMVGREVNLVIIKKQADPKEAMLTVKDLHVDDDRDYPAVRGVSFEVKAGEVLGIAGVQGNGQTQLAEALSGLRATQKGYVVLAGKDITNKTPRAITQAGLANIPEDRQRHGLVLSYSIADNMALCDYYHEPFSKSGVIQPKALDENAQKLISTFDVRTPSSFVSAGKLSGGNQQKVIVARELSRSVKLVIANQPTRGLDVGSIEYIHGEIIKMRDRDVAVLLISAELDEILALSDRIAVMYRGQIVTIVDTKKTTREQLGLWMAGAQVQTAQ